ncbi:hypothetical protein COHA_009463 [Chlorella ohadii]|uniref:Protein kinase domain-containing protein n=1 Tax=Chlorella ohadii TaxID=2649997 RepID=A0AAD5DEP3_9CHLO|nr:hypothetical protein COHA_009463 [Chlorella ohadii]
MDSRVTSGFPVQRFKERIDNVYVEYAGQGIQGGDFPCPGSLVPNACALASWTDALFLCFVNQPACKALVIYSNDASCTDGCSPSPVAVLKTVLPNIENTFVYPTVSTLLSIDLPRPFPYFLYDHEVQILPPTPAQIAANNGSLAANGTGELGCAVAENALMFGTVVATLDGVDSPAACCAACQRLGWGPAGAGFVDAPNVTGCNAYNLCTRPGGCSSFEGFLLEDSAKPVSVRLEQGQCELRWLEISSISLGTPLVVIAKGPGVQFIGGGPLALWPPDRPGYALLPGRGLYVAGRYPCEGSLRPWSCDFEAPLDELDAKCQEDGQCAAMAVKPYVPLPSPANDSMTYRGFLRNASSPEVRLLITTSALYVKDTPAQASSSSGLFAGDIAGIAVGCAVAALVAVLALAVVLRQRRQRTPQQLEQGSKAGASREPSDVEEGGSTATPAPSEPALLPPELLQELFIRECLHLQQLRHPCIVSLSRDLHSALQVTAAGTSERLFAWQRRGRRVAHEVARALNYLHSKNVIHLDIKSPNVLLSSLGAAKLADVGFSKALSHTFLSDVGSKCGTLAWVAPEILLGHKQIGPAVDIYSFGVLIWEIVTGQRPARGQLRMPMVPDECPQEVCDLMLECLSDDPAKRPTAQQLVSRIGAMLDEAHQQQAEQAQRAGSAASEIPVTPVPAPVPADGLPGQVRHVELEVPPFNRPSPFAAAAGPAAP